MRRIIMAALLVASFVPSFARAEEPSIELGLSIVNGLEKIKSATCVGTTKDDCERAYGEVIDSMRNLIKVQVAKAAAKRRGDQAEVTRLNYEIIRISEDGLQKSVFARGHFPAQPITVGAPK